MCALLLLSKSFPKTGGRTNQSASQKQHSGWFGNLIVRASISSKPCRVAIGWCDVDCEVGPVGVRLKQIAGRTNPACAADRKAEAINCSGRIAATERYVKIADSVHLTAGWGKTVNTYHVCDIQTGG